MFLRVPYYIMLQYALKPYSNYEGTYIAGFRLKVGESGAIARVASPYRPKQAL